MDYINLFAERNGKIFQVDKYNGKRGTSVHYSGTFIKKILKPQRMIFSLRQIKWQLRYGEQEDGQDLRFGRI